ncbi:MAG: TonB-dependent receptor [Bacteroidetes bacterium]|nr:MAG: TonB-dependent receptor [Bacteroidota bacterium]
MIKKIIPALFLFFVALGAGAQTLVSGTVTDAEDQLPLIGVTITVKGTTSGTATDLDGKYSIRVPDEKAVLVFSYTGYTEKEVPVAGKTEINVSLEPAISDLNEVVVVGYGVQKKSVVTGSISQVKSEQLKDMPVSRIEQSLQGRTSGVRVTANSGQPGSGAVVRIRGTTNLFGGSSSDPLYVVDGVIINGGIDYLSQGDIESIEVLKDAASAAIYGARGANGVIIITTKQGKKGKPVLNYNGYYGVQNPWRKLSLLNATEYAILMNEAQAAAGQPIMFEDPSALGEGTDWQDAVFQENAPIQNHEFSFSAANDVSNYYASFSYFDQEGIVASSDSRYKRFTARFNATHKLTDRLTFGSNLGYTRTNSRGVSENSEFGSPLSRAINIDPITPLYETREEVLNSNVFKNFPVVRDEKGVFGISDLVTSEIVNPVAALEVAQGNGWSDKIVGNFYLEYEILDGLKAKSSFGTDFAFWGGEGFTPIHYLNATNFAEKTSYSQNKANGRFLSWENTLNYTKTFGNHSIGAVAGYSVQKNTGESQTGIIQDIPVDNINDASLLWPNDPSLQSFFGWEYEDRVVSYFGRLNYNFKEKYLLTAIVRRDGSTKFGSNNKFGNFPSVSVGWIASEEPFFPNNNVVKFLKVRGSYGINGNDRIAADAFLATVSGGRTYTFGTDDLLVNGVAPDAADNPDLKWEETSQLNFGLDARLFRHISFTFDYFKKKTDGMLLRVGVPGLFGNGGPIANIADLENTGYEFELGYDNKIGDLEINFSGNLSYVENKVLFLTNETDFLVGQRFGPQGLEITRTTVGLPIGHFYGYKTDGIFQNQAEIDAYVNADGDKIQPNAAPGDFKFLDINGDGILSDDDRTNIGDPTPSYTYGFNFSAAWRGFDLNLFGQGVWGNEIYNVTRRFDLPFANYEASALGRWTGEGTSNDYPRLIVNDPNGNFNRSSDFHVQNGAFFRIKTLQIGYNLPADVLSKVGIQNARFYVSGNNLYTFTKYKGFDPEIGAGAGVDRGIYPQARFYLIGTNITF